MTQYTITVSPVEWGSDGTHGWEDVGDEIYLDLDPSYSDKVDFSFKSLFQTEIVQPAEWLRVAKNVSRYNKAMYNNWADHFHKLLRPQFINVKTHCDPDDRATLTSLYPLADPKPSSLEDLLSSCQSFIKVTKDRRLHKAVEDLRDDLQTILN